MASINFTPPISVSLAPNLFPQDVLLALQALFSPRQYLRGANIKKLEESFGNFFHSPRAISFSSGRVALLAILKSLGLGAGDEVLVQSFTCVVVANSILAIGAKPVFVDISPASFNLDPSQIAAKITSQTKAVIVQHTFGYPSEMAKITALAKKHRLFIIEDCAHGLGITYQNKLLGSFGDAAFFSLGRDKAISAVFGGLAIAKSKTLAQKIRTYQQSLSYPSPGWVVSQLLHSLVFALVVPLYNFFNLGKIILVLAQKLKIISFPVVDSEKAGHLPQKMIARLPNALAGLGLSQFKRLGFFNQKRIAAVDYYLANLKGLPVKTQTARVDSQTIPLLRFSLLTPQAEALYRYAQKRGVLFNNWYYPPLSPAGVSYPALGYRPKDCPVAEKIAPQVVNLPTHPKMTLAKLARVVAIIKEFFL